MRCSDGVVLIVLVVLVMGAAVASGCGASNVGLELLVDPPRVEALSPASGVAGQRVSVVISGQALHPRVVQDVGNVSGVRVEADFSAWLGEAPLEQVTWIDETRLSAVVPAALAAGRHDLRVRTPNGLETSLAGAYRALDPDPPLDIVIQPQPVVTSVGGLIGVRVRVTNRGSGDLLDVEARGLSAVPEGVAALTTDGATSPVALSPGASAELAFTFVATAPGVVSFTAGAQGVDTFGNVIVSPAPVSSALVAVQPAAGLSVSLAAEPATVVVGSVTELVVTVTNDGETGAAGVTPALLHDGALLTVLEGPTPSAADVPGGERATFTFTARAEASGTGLVTASARGSDALSGRDALGPPSTAIVTAVEPPSLAGAWTVPARVSLAQPFEATLRVTNTGGSGVVGLVATVTAQATSGASCGDPTPSVVPALAVGEAATFVYACTAAATSGALTVGGFASGARAVDGAVVSSPTWQSAAVVVERPPELALAWSEPEGAAAGRRYGAALTVVNVGEATALEVEVGDFDVEGDTGTLCGAAASPESELPGGAAMTFVFDCVAGPRAGLARLGATVSARDGNSGAVLAAGGSSAGVLVVAAAPLAVLVSEVVTDPRHDWDDSDGAGVPFDHVPGHGRIDAGDEWLELYNAGTTTADLRGLLVTLADDSPTSFVLGDGDEPPLRFSAGGDLEHFAPGERVVVGRPGGEAGMADDVWIFIDTPGGLRVDEVALGAGLGGPENLPYNAPSGASVDESGSIARVPAGADTGNDAVDFARAPFTIGRANECETRSSVAFVASSSSSTDAPPLSFSHDATGSDALLLVGVASRSLVGEVSYGGIPLTLVGTASTDGASLWALPAPPAGTSLVVVHAAPGKVAAGAVTLAGAHQAEPVGSVAFAEGSTSSPTLALDVPEAGATIVDVLCVKQSVVATPSGAQALAWREVGSVGAGVGGGSSTFGPVTTTGSATLAWSLDNPGPWTWVAASFLGQCQ